MQSIQTTVAIIGGGPAGVILALLFAKSGIEVTLLEQHSNFDRLFRGDSIHPSTMELLEQLGLIEALHQLPHTKTTGIPTQTPDGPVTILDLRVLRTKYPYIMLVPQVQFLEFITAEAAKHPNFRLIMRAGVRKLLEENGTVKGVAYQTEDGWCEVHAALTVAADGRHSMVRQLAGFKAKTVFTSPTDSLWFNIPRAANDPHGSTARITQNNLILVILERNDHWQISRNIAKGTYANLKNTGLEAFKQDLRTGLPEFADRINSISDWKAFQLLSVEITMLERWHKDGLLLIGDAAHTMGPALGVGINMAIQDAVITANTLTPALLKHQAHGLPIPESLLEHVQRQHQPITKWVQRIQNFAGQQAKRVLAGKPMLSPMAKWISQQRLTKHLMARLVGLGWSRPEWHNPTQSR